MLPEDLLLNRLVTLSAGAGEGANSKRKHKPDEA